MLGEVQPYEVNRVDYLVGVDCLIRVDWLTAVVIATEPIEVVFLERPRGFAAEVLP